MVELTSEQRELRHREREEILYKVKDWIRKKNIPEVIYRDELMEEITRSSGVMLSPINTMDVSDIHYPFRKWFRGFKDYCQSAKKRGQNISVAKHFEQLLDAYEKTFDCYIYKYDLEIRVYIKPNYYDFKRIAQKQGVAVMKRVTTVTNYFMTFEIPTLTGISLKKLKEKVEDAQRLLSDGSQILEGNCVFCGRGEMILTDKENIAVCTTCGEAVVIPIKEEGMNLCPICKEEGVSSELEKQGDVWICPMETCEANQGIPFIKNLSYKIHILTGKDGNIIDYSDVECPYCGTVGDFKDIDHGNYRCKQCGSKIGKMMLRGIQIAMKEEKSKN